MVLLLLLLMMLLLLKLLLLESFLIPAMFRILVITPRVNLIVECIVPKHTVKVIRVTNFERVIWRRQWRRWHVLAARGTRHGRRDLFAQRERRLEMF